MESDERYDPDGDPVVAEPGGHPLDFRRESPSKETRWLGSVVAEIAEAPAEDTATRYRLDRAIRRFGGSINTDYPALLRDLWERPVARGVLAGLVAEWTAECAAGDLLGLELTLPRLIPLAEAGYAELDPAFADVTVPDPIDVVVRALRSGLPEELSLPTVRGPAAVTAVQHGDLLTVGIGNSMIEVHGPEGVVHRAAVRHPGPAVWWDGRAFHLSRLTRGRSRRETFRLADDGGLAAEPLDLWPDGPASAQVTFPGAAAPVTVMIRHGMFRVEDAGGRALYRIEASPAAQTVGEGVHPILPPPGWWTHCGPVDPDASAALRRIDRGTVVRLVGAALRGRRDLDARLARALPAVTGPHLAARIGALVAQAASLLPAYLRICDALGRGRPADLPDLVRPAAGLRTGRMIREMITLRRAGEQLRRAIRAEPPETGVPRRLRSTGRPITVRDFPVSRFGCLGALAVEATWPWILDGTRTWHLATLAAWGSAPWGDGGGQWRLREFTFPGHGAGDLEGVRWRTPNGVMAVVRHHVTRREGGPIHEATVVEYAPDGAFAEVAFTAWTPLGPAIPQGWGGAERIARFTRLLAERGPVPHDPAVVHRIVKETGLPPDEVASACYGHPFFLGRQELARFPADLLALFTDPDTGEPVHSRSKRSHRLEAGLRNALMPEEPEDLWITGLDADRAVDWWHTTGRHLVKNTE
ncbi:hypothetical protein [Thermomonospora cellulosilytica]|uniref:Uncharacterized protein n=1 Tax=Thermomonospora cellulosilytica TaxID=1411118 RepID=A0A7W3MSK1_9ACTN|nr:hypothetical protein [Thermomonospora cellulosilytica]MBA9001135.1 hypothetical protein [Thermomonospora cellulosilytica]